MTTTTIKSRHAEGDDVDNVLHEPRRVYGEGPKEMRNTLPKASVGIQIEREHTTPTKERDVTELHSDMARARIKLGPRQGKLMRGGRKVDRKLDPEPRGPWHDSISKEALM